MEGVKVHVQRQVPITLEDGSTEYVDHVVFAAPSERTGGLKYTAAVVPLDDLLGAPDLRASYVRNAAYSLADYERPYRRGQNVPLETLKAWKETSDHLRAEYEAALDPLLGKALADA